MKRFLAAMTLGMTLVVGTVSAQAADLSVTVNGQAVTFDAQPFVEQNITLVPMRAIMDNLGATIAWDAQTKTATAIKEDKTVVLTIDSKVAMVNGQAVELETAAKIVGNRTFVPVEFIAEQFGLNVEWNEEENVVSLTEVVAEPEEDTTPAEEEVTAPTESEDATTPAEGETAADDTEKVDDETEADDTEKADDETAADDTEKADDETEADDTEKADDETEADDTTPAEDEAE